MAVLDRDSYRKLRLSDFNTYDIERTLRENIYSIEQENVRIESFVRDMIKQKIPVTIILEWLRQMEDNAAEIVYTTSLFQTDLTQQNFSTSNLYKRKG
jgi:hypothetical protein